MEKEIILIHLALFFQQNYEGNFEEFSRQIKNKLGNSKNTVYIPVPENAPVEIPRLILNYEKFDINVSKNRIDIFLKQFENKEDMFSGFISVSLNDLKLTIGRIGYVKKFFVESEIIGISKLFKKKINNLKDTSVRINIKDNIIGYDCNNIENLAFGQALKTEEGIQISKKGIIIDRDINTLSEKLKENFFDVKKIEEIVKLFEEKSNNFVLYE